MQRVATVEDGYESEVEEGYTCMDFYKNAKAWEPWMTDMKTRARRRDRWSKGPQSFEKQAREMLWIEKEPRVTCILGTALNDSFKVLKENEQAWMASFQLEGKLAVEARKLGERELYRRRLTESGLPSFFFYKEEGVAPDGKSYCAKEEGKGGPVYLPASRPGRLVKIVTTLAEEVLKTIGLEIPNG